jgi:uncharacterized membrane protein YhaH (DUF805 family)
MANYFSFSGRISRQTYWLGYILPALAIGFAAGLIDAANGHHGAGIGPASLITTAFWLWPGTAAMVKRCHDRGKSGWWVLLVFVPLVGALWSLVELGCLRGTDRANEYGGDPLETRWAAVA